MWWVPFIQRLRAITQITLPEEVIKSDSRWEQYVYKCPICSSRNLIPSGEYTINKDSLCYYSCKDCNHEFGPVVYCREY